MNAAERRVTYAEMLEWPDDGRRYELYDGEVVVVPAPVLRHQRVALHLMGLLRDYEESRGGIVVPAPFDIVFSQQNVVEPDVVYFRPERQHLLNPSSAAYAWRLILRSKCCHRAPSGATVAARWNCSRGSVCPSTGSSIPRGTRSKSSCSAVARTR